MLCPKCGYALSAFDKDCPRCALQASAPPAAPPPPVVTPPPGRPPALPPAAYASSASAAPPRQGASTGKVLKIVLISVLGGILGIAILTIATLTFLGNKMRNELAAANAASSTLVVATPAPASGTTTTLTPLPISGAAPQTATTGSADYLEPERKWHEAYMKWNYDYTVARNHMKRKPLRASDAAAFESGVNAIWDARNAYTDVPARFVKANDLLGEALVKVRQGISAANVNDPSGLNLVKDGEDIMAESVGEFDHTCDTIREEAAPKGVKFFN